MDIVIYRRGLNKIIKEKITTPAQIGKCLCFFNVLLNSTILFPFHISQNPLL